MLSTPVPYMPSTKEEKEGVPMTSARAMAEQYVKRWLCEDNEILWERGGHYKEEVEELVALLAQAQREMENLEGTGQCWKSEHMFFNTIVLRVNQLEEALRMCVGDLVLWANGHQRLAATVSSEHGMSTNEVIRKAQHALIPLPPPRQETW